MIWLTEQHLYGSSRLGIDKETRLIADSIRVRLAVFNPLVGWWKEVSLVEQAALVSQADTGLRQPDTLGVVHFEIANHLGNVVAVVSDRKIAVDTLAPFTIDHFLAGRIMLRDYYAFGMTMPGRSWAVDSSYRFGFNGKEKMLGLNGLDFGARVNDVRLGRWLSPDPLAEERTWVSPYNFVQNCPINRADPTGALDNPIYSKEGDFLGTDDTGLQGEAIIMNKSDFQQGMYTHESLAKGTLRSDVSTNDVSQSALNKLDQHFADLPKRPDYDGYITLSEANDWYQTGNGQPLFASLDKLDLRFMRSKGDNYNPKERHVVSLYWVSMTPNDFLVYGSISILRYPGDRIRAFQDEYNFEMHRWIPSEIPRNLETIIGGFFAGEVYGPAV